MGSERNNYDFIAIGTSAGGVSVLRRMLQMLAPSFSLPIGIVQHLSPRARLDVGLIYGLHASRTVVEVEDKMVIQGRHVYMAAPDYHLLVEREGSFALSQDERVNWSRPSIDVFFESAAETFGKRTVGILLTGANSDGALGLARIATAGGLTMVQDPHEAEVDVMPRAAIALRPPAYVEPLDGIVRILNSLVQERQRELQP